MSSTQSVTGGYASHFFTFDPSGNTDSVAGYAGSQATDTLSAPFLNYDTPNNASGFGPDGQDGTYAPAEDAKAFGLLQPVLMGARWYSTGGYGTPTLSRFLTRDPSGYAGGLNLYAYADNNPVNESDPSGLNPENDGDPMSYDPGDGANGMSIYSGTWNNFAGSDDFKGGSQQRRDISNLIQQIPGIGTALSGYIALTGCDPVAGAPVNGLDRAMALAAALGPMFEALGEARECGSVFGCFARVNGIIHGKEHGSCLRRKNCLSPHWSCPYQNDYDWSLSCWTTRRIAFP